MKFYVRSAGVGLMIGLGVFMFYAIRVAYTITIAHRWHDLRRL